MKQLKKLVVFDMDGTLINTPTPELGKKVWEEYHNTKWPHKGWWSKKESLDLDAFTHPLNEFVYDEYKKHILDPSAVVILMTGRMEKLRPEVTLLLNHHKLDFDGVYLNRGGDTLSFKKREISNMLDKLGGIDEIIIYEDREPHVKAFRDYLKEEKR